MTKTTTAFERDPRWYKNAVIYQAHVRAFYDSNGDGIGDFPGLTEKLDYIQDLGATAIWLLPFYPSPLRDGGYDISDYRGVNPSYGTLEDFRRFVDAAHDRGLRVITELVLNHTSDQHPWFQRARRAPKGSPERDWYVWTDDPSKYKGTRIIFKDFEASNWSWDPLAGQYYWHRFYHHQPDLNWDNPVVEKELQEVLRYWLDMGVDGLRLDAVPYLYEREGTNCENLKETHDALKRLRTFVDDNFEDRMILAEANQWPEDSVEYFGAGDECHMAFHFPIMPRLFMSLMTEDRFPLIDIIQQTPEIPENCQWAVFLRNHDELTLEMVTDEERDYMYRSYASEHRARINLGIRRRLAPLLENYRPRIELLNALLFAFNGTPIVYYGDEIGMGDNIYLGDRDGVRTPMQWTADRNAGFSRANPHKLYLPVNIDPEYRYEAINVEAQQQNPTSLWWWMKRLIGVRRRYPVLGRGEIEFLRPENSKILAFIRKDEEQEILIVANLARTVEFCELDLWEYEGRIPVEVFGRTRFPRIGQLPYLMTLDGNSFYWLDLSAHRSDESAYEVEGAIRPPPAIPHEGPWTNLLTNKKQRERLEAVLPQVLKPRRWFGGKARTVDEVRIEEVIRIDDAPHEARLLLLRVCYEQGPEEVYSLAVAGFDGELAQNVLDANSWASLVRLDRKGDGEVGLLVDGLDLPEVRRALFEQVRGKKRWPGDRGHAEGVPTRQLAELAEGLEDDAESWLMRVEQSNTSFEYGEKFMMKLFRRLSPGVNPDVELGRHLTEDTDFEAFPKVGGSIEYTPKSGEGYTLALLQELVPNDGDAWSHTKHELSRFLEAVHVEQPVFEVPRGLMATDLPDEATEWIGGYLKQADLLGRRVGEMHLALGKQVGREEIDPEPYVALSQRALYQSMRSLTGRTLELLDKRRRDYSGRRAELAEKLSSHKDAVHERLRSLLDVQLSSPRIRCHGDLHLGQVLITLTASGHDYKIIDFEGEPARPIGERRIKRSPYRDVAGMVRSYHYAAYAALRHEVETGVVDVGSDAYRRLEQAVSAWYVWVSRAFLGRYHEVAAPLLSQDPRERAVLLDVHLLEKAVYELGYELNNRPDWVELPLTAILGMLDGKEHGTDAR